MHPQTFRNLALLLRSFNPCTQPLPRPCCPRPGRDSRVECTHRRQHDVIRISVQVSDPNSVFWPPRDFLPRRDASEAPIALTPTNPFALPLQVYYNR